MLFSSHVCLFVDCQAQLVPFFSILSLFDTAALPRHFQDMSHKASLLLVEECQEVAVGVLAHQDLDVEAVVCSLPAVECLAVGLLLLEEVEGEVQCPDGEGHLSLEEEAWLDPWQLEDEEDHPCLLEG